MSAAPLHLRVARQAFWSVHPLTDLIGRTREQWSLRELIAFAAALPEQTLQQMEATR